MSHDVTSWVLIVNSDIAFYPGVLQRMSDQVNKKVIKNPLFGIGFTSLCCGGQWSAVIFTRKIISEIGYFDENFFPAYFEDDDYAIRVSKGIMQAVKFDNIPLIHGELNGSIGYYGSTFRYINQVKEGSKDPLVFYAKKLLEAGFINSGVYMKKKWGLTNTWKNDCKSIVAMNNKNFSGRGECKRPFLKPFNRTENSLSYW
eukprot:CAMPEP_0119038176 /NCGR_PEP_ID=MMETSP1177-20130426/6903_1 /TAXON_ID=2985 /ORGANISM="Ochromonas sp, Strain CCMP1899" /LENGTH=200 /DNA_ID=CAMNT_0007000363 /DNA_START=413 /DNA_END=1012 /DNA_ORIENTATION=+